MSAVHRLKATEPPAISPLRVALADRIEQSRAVTARSAAVSTAFETAEMTVRAARRKLEEAEAGVAQSKIDAASFLTSVALGEARTRPPTINQARVIVQDATDDLESAIAARDGLRAQMTQGEGGPELNQVLLRDAALAVIRNEAAASAASVVAEVAGLQAALAEKAEELKWLAEADLFPKGAFGGVTGAAAPVLTRLNSPPSSWAGLSAEQHAGRARWQGALERLMTDAGAELS
jgi:hypothetical protein